MKKGMKRIAIVLSVALILVSMLGVANATLIPFQYTNSLDFKLTTYNGVTCNVVTSPGSFSYNPITDTNGTTNLTTPPYYLSSATLTLTHSGNKNAGIHLWSSYADEPSPTADILIGSLSDSSKQGQTIVWKTDTWTWNSTDSGNGPSILQLMTSHNPWSLTIDLQNGETSNPTNLYLDKSTLTLKGNYDDGIINADAVPLPAPLFLLGSGIVGLARVARRKK